MIYSVFISIVETFIIFGVGALAWRLGMIETKDVGKLSRLTLDIFFPLLTFSTITRTFDRSNLYDLWLMPLLGFGMILFSAIIGWGAKKLMRAKGHGREATFHHLCAVNNYVFLPIIVLQNIYGERHIALLLVMNVGSTIGLWTIGVLTLTGGGSWKDALKSIVSFNIIAVAAAVLVVLTGAPVPEVAEYVCKYLGDATVPLMLVVIGAALASSLRGML